MHERQDVARLRVVKALYVRRRVRRGDDELLGTPRGLRDKAPAGDDAHILFPELQHHRVRRAEDKGNKTRRLRGVLHLPHECEPGTVLHGALREADKIAAGCQALLILLIVQATVHRGRQFAARETLLKVLSSHVLSPSDPRRDVLTGRVDFTSVLLHRQRQCLEKLLLALLRVRKSRVPADRFARQVTCK